MICLRIAPNPPSRHVDIIEAQPHISLQANVRDDSIQQYEVSYSAQRGQFQWQTVVMAPAAKSARIEPVCTRRPPYRTRARSCGASVHRKSSRAPRYHSTTARLVAKWVLIVATVLQRRPGLCQAWQGRPESSVTRAIARARRHRPAGGIIQARPAEERKAHPHTVVVVQSAIAQHLGTMLK